MRKKARGENKNKYKRERHVRNMYLRLSATSNGKSLLRDMESNRLWRTRLYNTAICLNYYGSRLHFGGPWMGPINADLKYLICPVVTPRMMRTLFRLSAKVQLLSLPTSFLYAAMVVRPPSNTVSRHLSGSIPTVLLPFPSRSRISQVVCHGI